MTGNFHSGVLSHYSDCVFSAADAVGGSLKKLARHMNDAFETQRRRDIDHEIERLLAQSRGRLTDSVEREIAETVMASDWRLPH
jgi:hypothetical protein